MPLSERARVEVYIPDLPSPAYSELLAALTQEFSFTFGGCSVLQGISGSYLSSFGLVIPDRVNLIYTDVSLSLTTKREVIERYADRLRQAAFEALDEEAVLVATYPVHHSTD